MDRVASEWHLSTGNEYIGRWLSQFAEFMKIDVTAIVEIVELKVRPADVIINIKMKYLIERKGLWRETMRIKDDSSNNKCTFISMPHTWLISFTHFHIVFDNRKHQCKKKMHFFSRENIARTRSSGAARTWPLRGI